VLKLRSAVAVETGSAAGIYLDCYLACFHAFF